MSWREKACGGQLQQPDIIVKTCSGGTVVIIIVHGFTHIAYSIGVFVSMLTFVLDQPPLVMFSLLILAGILGGISGNIFKLYSYRKGF